MMTPRDDEQRRREEERRIENEIRARHAADPASILAGRDGGDHLRGASPTPVRQRALLEAEQWLRQHLRNPDVSLRTVILRRLEARGELLEEHLGQPATLCAGWLTSLLAAPEALAEFVREVDMAWGLANQERPHFERDDRPGDPDDPFTIDGVRRVLAELLASARRQV